MKEGWTYKKIGDVFKTYAGGTPSKSNKANYENGSIPWIRSGEVCKKYITESELFISEEGLKNSSAKYYPINTVLIAMYGATAAQCGILKFEATSNQAVCGILPREGISPEFVYAYFTYIKEYLAAQAQGGAQPNISQEKLKKVLFPCVPHSEQLSIVSRLDAAFAHIDALKANAEKQLAEARQLFQKLSDGILQNEYWKKTTLHEICKQITDGTHRTPHYISKGVPFLSVKNVTSGYIDFENTKFISEEEHSEFVKRCNPTYGDILYTKVGTTGVAKVIDVKQKFSIFVSLALLKVEDDLVYNKFLEYVLNSPYVYKQSQKLTSGAANRNFLLNDIKKVELFLPPLNTQYQIVSRLDALSANIKKLEELQRKTLAECDALKQAMLREVFE